MNKLTYFIQIAEGILLSLLLIPIGLAAPVNDNFANAIPIEQLPTTLQQDTTEASNEANEILPNCLNEVAASVWYQYTATRNQTVVLNTFDSDYDTVLSVWTGTTHPLTQLACNDDSSNTSQSQVSLELEQGTTYYINISGYTGETGTLILNALPVNELTNDNIANALKITQNTDLSYSHTQSVKGGSTESNEAGASCAPQREFASVWYKYTPTTTQSVVFNTIGSDYNTILSVWTGRKHPLTEIACNDDNGMAQSQLRAELQKGKTYYLKITASATASGSLSEGNGLLILNMTMPPANDNLANAIPITEAFPYTTNQYTGGATVENDELFPTCSPNSGTSVWYLLTPSTDYDNLAFSTAGSGYDTVLSIWQDINSSFTELACNDNAIVTEQSNASQITIPLTENLTYYIDISGVDNSTGNLILRVEEGTLDFQIAAQPQEKFLQACQSTTLAVGLSTIDGKEIDLTTDPVGTQWETFTALPFVYQWYQGESGDNRTPVGIDSYLFQTPFLTETTQYWVRVSNPTGKIDSETVTATVEPIDNNNGIGIDAEGNPLSTQAHFIGLVTTPPENNDSVSVVNQDDTISIIFTATVDPNHLEQFADILMVGRYTVNDQTFFYMREGEMWKLWNMDMAELTAAHKETPLSECLVVPVFEGQLKNMPGDFTAYVGYRLNEGQIFFNGEPVNFTVE